MSVNTHSLDLELSSSQYAKVADTVPLSITGDLTVECWVKLETLPSANAAQMNFCGKWEVNSDRRSYRLIGLQASDKPTFALSSSGAAAQADSFTATTILGTGVWTHIAATYAASTGSVTF